MSARELTYAELLATCEELRRTAARAISIKQELITTQEALDRELDRYRQIQRYIERALPIASLSAFAALTVETVVEYYEVEAALLLLLPPRAGGEASADVAEAVVVGMCGLSSCPETLPLELSWLRARQAGLFHAESALSAAWSALAVQDVLLLPLLDAQAQPQGALAVLRTERGADFFPQLPTEKRSSLGLFADQVQGLLRNLKSTELIRSQVVELKEALQRKQEEQALRLAEEERSRRQQELIAAQRETLRELATPLMPIAEGILVVPLLGAVDRERALLLLEAVLQGVQARRAKTVIVDVTGVPSMDREIASLLVRLTQAVQLLGAEVVLSGLRAEVAQRMVELRVDLRALRCVASLQAAIQATLLRGPAR
jgi:anti-anti-sigma regulatory factor